MSVTVKDLPGLDCGVCGFRTCSAFADQLVSEPDLIKRCIQLSRRPFCPRSRKRRRERRRPSRSRFRRAALAPRAQPATGAARGSAWQDSLGREFDFYLEHFPEEPGPREIILPHNPLITREMDIQPGDTLIGRPLGMSCGCPITHCGVAMQVDHRTGVIVWCVTGPLRPAPARLQGPGLLHRRGIRRLGPATPAATQDRDALLFPADDVHAAVAAQRAGELPEPHAGQACRSAWKACGSGKSGRNACQLLHRPVE